MSSKKIVIIFTFLLAIGIVIQFVSFDFILSYLKNDFSSDGIIEKTTYLNYKHKFQLIKILAIIFPVLSIVFLSCYKIIGDILSSITAYVSKKILNCYSKIGISSLFWFSLAIIIFFVAFAAYNFDVGQDEAFYLNDIQNIVSHGSVYRDMGEKSFSYDIPNLPLNIVANITVPIFGFSILHIRYIILLFSLLIIPLLFRVFGKDIAQLITLLILLFPGIFSLTSTVYLESTAFLLVLLALLFLKKHEKEPTKINFMISALFMAISMATKIQLVLWIGLILFVLLIVDYKKSAIFIFKYFLTVYSFFLIMIVFSILHIGFHDGILFSKFVFIGGNTSGAFSLNLSIIVNKTLMLNEMIFIPLLIFIWVKSWRIIKEKYNNLYMKFIYIGAIVIVLHWLLLFDVMTWRNVFIGLAFNAILFAIYLKENYKLAKLILIPYIFVGIISNYGFIKNGVRNDIQCYRAHVLNSMMSLDRNTNQKEFFREISEIIHSEDIVYVPLQPYIARIYLNNREIKYLKNYHKSDDKSYLIVTSGDVVENYVEKFKLTKYLVNSEIVLKKGNYTLYKLH